MLDVDDEDHISSHAVAAAISLALASGELTTQTAWPPVLCQSLLRHRDGVWPPDIIACRLIKWANAAAFPFTWDYPALEGFDQLLSSDHLASHSPCIVTRVHDMQLVALQFPHGDAAHFLSHLAVNLLRCIGPRVLVALLGLRTTVGYLSDRLPPPRSVLVAAFEKMHGKSSSSRLTVGARALAKHCHRGAESWWGECTGSETEKSEAARHACTRILDEAVWVNAHCIVHGTKLIEYRVAAGYGARWSFITRDRSVHIDSDALCSSAGSEANFDEYLCEFRGFLEPHVVGGHERKWRH